MEITFRKLAGHFIPLDEEDEEVGNKIKGGDIVKMKVLNRNQRRIKYHRRVMKMIRHGFEHWEPKEILHKGMPIEKHFETFRKDITIAAGFYEIVPNIRGELRKIALSIDFESMEQDEFEKLNSACCNVLLTEVFTNYTRDDLDSVVDELVRLSM